jgi:hypothetical protein
LEEEPELLGDDELPTGAVASGSEPDQREPGASAIGDTTGLTAPAGDEPAAVTGAVAGSLDDGLLPPAAFGGFVAAVPPFVVGATNWKIALHAGQRSFKPACSGGTCSR